MTTILPLSKQKEIESFVQSLSLIKGIKAIVLGGSFARGTAHAESDIDLGLYYNENCPIDITMIRHIAKQMDSSGIVTELYEWGPWVNGGAWLKTSLGEVDLLYRNVDQIKKVITESHEGIFQCDFSQQPPFGYYSVTYLGETKTCIPLYDPEGIISQLKEKIVNYPLLLKETIINRELWSAEFSLLFANKSVKKQDFFSATGSFTRFFASIVQVLFALNEVYYISDKEALSQIQKFAITLPNLNIRMQKILREENLIKAVQLADDLFQEIKQLNHQYIPLYKL